MEFSELINPLLVMTVSGIYAYILIQIRKDINKDK